MTRLSDENMRIIRFSILRYVLLQFSRKNKLNAEVRLWIIIRNRKKQYQWWCWLVVSKNLLVKRTKRWWKGDFIHKRFIKQKHEINFNILICEHSTVAIGVEWRAKRSDVCKIRDAPGFVCQVNVTLILATFRIFSFIWCLYFFSLFSHINLFRSYVRKRIQY